MKRAIADRLRGQDGARGSVSSWLISASFVLILGVGIAVDLTGQVHAQTRVTNLANEAARAGAQQLDIDAAVAGRPSGTLDTAAAVRAATAYLATAGLAPSQIRVRDDVVTVSVATQYDTKFLSIVAISQMPVTGTGESRAVQAVDGVEL